jgi:hypothetical protein
VGIVFGTTACASSGSSSGGAGGAGGAFVGTGPSTTTGGSTTTGAGGSNNSNPGTFDSIWKRESALLQTIDSTSPFPTTQPITLPSTITEPVDGREVDFYQQILNDTLISYVWRTEDTSYYRIEQALTKANDSYVLSTDGASHLFLIKNGRLTDQTSMPFGQAVFISTATYAKYDGPFPPATWPAEVIDFK